MSADIVVNLPALLSKEVSLQIFVDNTILRIFLDNRICYTQRFYTREPDRPILTLTLPGQWKAASLQTYALERIWPV